MTIFASDDFTGANNTYLQDHSALWVPRVTLGSSAYTRISDAGRIRSHYNVMRWTHARPPPSADYEVSADIYFASLSRYATAGVIARYDSDTGQHCELYAEMMADRARLTLSCAGASDSIDFRPQVGATHRLALRAKGTDVTGYLDGAEVLRLAGSAAGFAGFAGFMQRGYYASSNTAGIHLDRWRAESLAVAPPVRRRNRLALLGTI